MSPGRALKKHSIIRQLISYGQNVGAATDDPKLKKHKQILKEVDPKEQFFTETDLVSRRISWSHGIKKCLGYEDRENSDIRIGIIADNVHPLIKSWYKMYVNAATLAFTQIATAYEKSSFVIYVPIRDKEGNYILFKQISMPFAYNKKRKPVSFLNSYSMVRAYHGEPLQFRLELGSKTIESNTRLRIETLIRPCLEIPKRLTKNQLAIIDVFYYLKVKGEDTSSENVVNHYIAARIKKITYSTASRTLLRIKERLTSILDLDSLLEKYKTELNMDNLPDYKDPLRLIEFCEESGIINLLRRYKLTNFPRAKQESPTSPTDTV